MYRSPKHCQRLVRLRFLDATTAALVCVWNGALQLAEALTLSQSRFEATFFCWLAMGFAIGRVPWVVMLERRGFEIMRHSERGLPGAAYAAIRVVHQAAQDMLIAGSVFVFLFGVSLATHDSGLPCDGTSDDKRFIFTCHMKLATAYCFVILNCGFVLSSVVMLTMGPRIVHRRAFRSEPRVLLPMGLSPNAIRKLQTHDFGDLSAPPTQPQCYICLADFSEGEQVRYLPCGHHYHARCIDAWLARRAECPLRCHNVFDVGQASDVQIIDV